MSGGIRPVRRDDIDAVAQLYQRLVRLSEDPSPPGLAPAFERMFFDQPWVDPEVPSLVYADSDDRPVAFIGSHARPMVLGDRAVRAVASGQLVSEPGTPAGALLLKSFFAGSQDLLFTDGATRTVHQMWTQLGGVLAHVKCLRWTKVLRPSQYLASTERAGRLAPVLRAAAPLVDEVALRIGPYAGRTTNPHGGEEELTAALYVSALPKLFPSNFLLPAFDLTFVSALFDAIGSVTSRGPLESSVVRDTKGSVIGWYLYFRGGDGRADVLELAASARHQRDVLNHLFDHASARGCAAVQGRVEPDLLDSLAQERCTIRYAGPGVLVHAKDPELLTKALNGGSMMSRLEGEWWMAFHRDDYGS